MPDYAALGRSGALQQATRDIIQGASMLRQQRKEDAAEKEGAIRVPIPKMGPAPRATTTPIAEAIAARDEQLESPTGEPIEAPMATDIPTEQARAQQQHEQVTAELEEQKEQEVRAVDTLPIMQNLKQMPTAYNRMMDIARANGWIQNIGGVDTISNKQMRIAQGIIASDLKMNKEINELALGDITQNIVGLEQSLFDPKMKEDQKAQVQAQIDTLKAQQNSYLNAVNMMDRQIQKELATRAPRVPEAVKTKELMYQDEAGNYMWGLLDERGNVVKNLRAATQQEIKGKGAKALSANEYRQWVKQAEVNAYKDIFANKPGIMDEIAAMESEPDETKREQIEAKLHTALTPTQRAKMDELIERYFKKSAPESVWSQYRSIKGSKRKGTKAISDPLGLR